MDDSWSQRPLIPCGANVATRPPGQPRTRRAIAACTVLLGLFAMHVLGTHGATGGSMTASPVVAAESLHGVHAMDAAGVTGDADSSTGTASPGLTPVADSVDATRSVSATPDPPHAHGPSAVTSPGNPMGAMDAMATLCVVVLSLALMLLVRAALDRTAESLVGTVARARRPRVVCTLLGLDRRPPVVWEYSVLRC